MGVAIRAGRGPFLPETPLNRGSNRGFRMLNRRNGYEYEDLLACARGEMFGPGNAQLPSRRRNTKSRIDCGPGLNAWLRQNRLSGTARSLTQAFSGGKAIS